MSTFVRKAVGATILGVALTTAGSAYAATSVVGVLACTDKFVDNLQVHAYASCVA
jgi:hypothetical protein